MFFWWLYVKESERSNLLVSVDRYQCRFALRKPMRLQVRVLPAICMRAISLSKHTKVKKYMYENLSKGVLVNGTKIGTNENFSLYGVR